MITESEFIAAADRTLAGIGAALGYGVGVAISWFVRRLPVREPSPVVKRRAWLVLAVLGPVLAVYFLLLGVGWQNEVRTLVGEPDEGLTTALEVAIVAVPVAIGTLLVGRGLRRINGWIVRGLRRHIPDWVAGVVSAAIIGTIIYGVLTGVVFDGFVAAMNTIYSGTNASTKDGITAPSSSLRSGSGVRPAPFLTLKYAHAS